MKLLSSQLDQNLELKKISLVKEIVDLYQNETTSEQTLRSKIRELAMIMEDIYLHYKQMDSIKNIYSDICNTIIKNGISHEKQKSIRTYVYITLADQERYFLKYKSTSHLSTVIDRPPEESSVYFNHLLTNETEMGDLDLELLDRRQFQDLLEKKNANLKKMVRIAKANNIALTKDVEGKTEDTETKEDPYKEKIGTDKPAEPKHTRVLEAWDNMIEKMQVVRRKIHERGSELTEQEIEKAVAGINAFILIFDPATNDKRRKTFGQWCTNIKNMIIGGPSYAANQSASPTEIDPKTGEVKRRAMTKEQIEQQALPILNAMITILNNIGFFAEIAEKFVINHENVDRDKRADKVGEKLKYRRDFGK